MVINGVAPTITILTLARAAERNPDKRPALNSKWAGREGQLYTVQGKGGLIRHVLIPNDLAKQLEQRRLDNPVTITDRKINYLQRYDIGAGKRWSDSFSKASERALFFSTGAHGLRHSYAQERINGNWLQTFISARNRFARNGAL